MLLLRIYHHLAAWGVHGAGLAVKAAEHVAEQSKGRACRHTMPESVAGTCMHGTGKYTCGWGAFSPAHLAVRLCVLLQERSLLVGRHVAQLGVEGNAGGERREGGSQGGARRKGCACRVGNKLRRGSGQSDAWADVGPIRADWPVGGTPAKDCWPQTGPSAFTQNFTSSPRCEAKATPESCSAQTDRLPRASLRSKRCRTRRYVLFRTARTAERGRGAPCT